MGIYITRHNEKIELDQFDEKQKEFLRKVFRAYRANISFIEFRSLFEEPYGPAFSGQERLSLSVAIKPIYKVCDDIWMKIMARQGLLGSLEEQNHNPEENKTVIDDFLK